MTAIAQPAAAVAVAREPRPSFVGCLGAEVLKLRRQGMVWAMLGLACLFFVVLSAALFTNDNMHSQLTQSPRDFLFLLYDVYGAIFRTGSGILLLILSARLVGMEYSSGTIRVLLARGAGRIRLLLAKLTALALLGLALFAGFFALAAASTYLVVVGWDGSFTKITSLPSAAWTDLGNLVLIALASMAACILAGAAAAILGRSLAFGIGAALVIFPIDNALTVILGIVATLTKQHLWQDVSAYLLGPNLNALPVLMQPDHLAHTPFGPPLVTVTTAHAWLVIAAWLMAFAIVGGTLTWRRDVLQ